MPNLLEVRILFFKGGTIVTDYAQHANVPYTVRHIPYSHPKVSICCFLPRPLVCSYESSYPVRNCGSSVDHFRVHPSNGNENNEEYEISALLSVR